MWQHQPYKQWQPNNLPASQYGVPTDSLYVVHHSPPIPGRDKTISLLQKFHTDCGAHVASFRGPFSGESGRDWNVTTYLSARITKVRIKCSDPFCLFLSI